MHTFRIWAPAVKSASVKIGDTITPLQPDHGGWWQAIVDSAGHSTDYQFLLDGDDYAVPDPRSAWQPHGVHGPSRILDHNTFQWTDQNWQAPAWPEAIVYELHIGTFTPEGTFDAARERIVYLKDLGITHVELAARRILSRQTRLGIRRRRSLRSAGVLRRSRGVEALHRCLPRSRSRRYPRCGLQPSRSFRKLSG